jgi:hypothetical protein
LSSGQSAFRREPALVDRQQNIRIAMDLIVRDVQNAGSGMTSVPANLPQIFANNLDNPGAGSVPSEIFPGQAADFIEIMANDGTCPTLSVCGSPGGALFTWEPLPACMTTRPGLVFVGGAQGPAGSASGTPGLLWMNVPGPGGGGGCGGGAGGNVNLPAGLAAAYNPPGNQACTNPPGAGLVMAAPAGTANQSTPYCQSISLIQLVRYEIAPEQGTGTAPDIITNPPSLWRSDNGRRDYDLAANNGPHTGAQSPWQLVARGIDDMQIQYFTACPSPGGALGWCNIPGAVANTNLNTIVQQVRITLSARALATTAGGAQGLGGETIYAPGGTRGRRGQLTTTVAPRAALITLAAGSPTVQWR